MTDSQAPARPVMLTEQEAEMLVWACEQNHEAAGQRLDATSHPALVESRLRDLNRAHTALTAAHRLRDAVKEDGD